MRARLVRPRSGRRVAGVCAGIAQAYGFDVTLVRLITVVLVLAGFGSTVLFYLAAWIAMPNEVLGYMPPSAPMGSVSAA